MFLVAVLDLLFAYAFAGLAFAVLSVGVRIVLMSNDHRLILWSTILLVSGVASGTVACLWTFVNMGRTPKSSARRSNWKRIMQRYPVLIGPAAYYLGEVRPNKVQHASWFTRLMENRRALDVISFVAWRGTLAAYGLVVVALVAAVVQSSSLFTLVVAVFVALIPIVGAAFGLLSLVVLVHAAVAGPNESTGMRQLKAVPRVGPLWVRGFRQYYERMIRPALIKSEGRA